MELYQLIYFKEVARQKSYTKAAQMLSVTQPTLSIAIKKLETEMDVSLFQKDGKLTVLTEAGRLIEPMIDSILAEVELVHRSIDEYKNSRILRTRLGLPNMLCDDLLMAIKRQYPADFGASRIGIAQMRLQDIRRRLLDNDLDIGILIKQNEKAVSGSIPPRAEDTPELSYEKYKELECCAYVSPNHPLAKKDFATPAMLRDAELLISGKDEGLSDAVIAYLYENLDGGYTPKKGDMLDPYTVLRIAEHEGVAVLPVKVNIRGYNLVRVPIRPTFNIELTVARIASQKQTELQKEVVNFILDFAKNS